MSASMVRGFISVTMSCSDTAEKALSGEMMPGMNVPKCEADGSYYPQQCIGELEVEHSFNFILQEGWRINCRKISPTVNEES